MATPSIHVISADALSVLSEPLLRSARSAVVRSLAEIGPVLEAYAAEPIGPAVHVDLIGHSTRRSRLLQMGGTVVDLHDVRVRNVFEEIARSRVLPRAHAVSLRLLGCETAVSDTGKRTLRLLSDLLGLPVFGTNRRLSRTHYTVEGFNPLFGFALVEGAPSPLAGALPGTTLRASALREPRFPVGPVG